MKKNKIHEKEINMRGIRTMKYIRTKDGIVKHPHPNAEVFTFRYEIVKQADTIEELCDEFVWDEDLCYVNFKEKTLEIKRDDYTFDLDWCLKDSPIYGAIWTDKGLIYVAKMNDKGELELL